jgi:hypothetical protein
MTRIIHAAEEREWDDQDDLSAIGDDGTSLRNVADPAQARAVPSPGNIKPSAEFLGIAGESLSLAPPEFVPFARTR